MTIEADIYQALIAKTEALIFLPPLRLAYPRITFEPGNNESYIEIRHFPNSNGNPTWGTDKLLRGIWQLSLIVTGDQIGDVPPINITSEIAAAFQKNSKAAYGAAKVKFYQHPNPLTAITLPDKTIYPVSIPYQQLKLA